MKYKQEINKWNKEREGSENRKIEVKNEKGRKRRNRIRLVSCVMGASSDSNEKALMSKVLIN